MNSNLHQCDNCDFIHNVYDLCVAEDLDQRVDEGGPEPSGECPDCGCLCYPVEDGTVEEMLTVTIGVSVCHYVKVGSDASIASMGHDDQVQCILNELKEHIQALLDDPKAIGEQIEDIIIAARKRI